MLTQARSTNVGTRRIRISAFPFSIKSNNFRSVIVAFQSVVVVSSPTLFPPLFCHRRHPFLASSNRNLKINESCFSIADEYTPASDNSHTPASWLHSNTRTFSTDSKNTHFSTVKGKSTRHIVIHVYNNFGIVIFGGEARSKEDVR